MISMQQKVLDAIEEAAKSYELEPVISYSYSNTGTLYVMDGFAHILVIKFNFQSDYCSIEVENGYGEKKAGKGYIEYKMIQQVKKIIEFIDNYLREYDMEKNGAEEA